MTHLLVICPSYPDSQNQFIGGIFVKEQVDVLKEKYDKITVFAPKMQSFGILKKDKLCKDYSYDNVTVKYFGSFYFPPRLINYFVIDTRINLLLDEVAKLQPEPDLIYAHFTWPSGFAAAQIKKEYDIPYTLILHENSERFYDACDAKSSYFTYAWRQADLLLRVNPVDLQELTRYNSNVQYFANGVNNRFHYRNQQQARDHLGLEQDAIIIFSVGRLLHRKGFQDLIRAMDKVKGKHEDAILYIGGSGPYRSELEGIIDKRNLHHNVKLLGFVADEDLPYWMAGANLFVISSHSESFGIVALEALASGTPVISTRNKGSEYFVDDNGIIVPIKSPLSLANAIISALNSSWDNKAIADKYKKYQWKFHKEELFEYLSSIYNH